MRILLLVSAFNGLTQRVWCDLKEGGHDVGVVLAPVHDEASLVAAVQEIQPELILCPVLKHRVPEAVWGRYPTVVIHPGPVGDRGPSSLDHATLDGRSRWGVTALSAVEAWASGPETGDRGEIEDLPDNVDFWREVSASSENCVGSSSFFRSPTLTTQRRSTPLVYARCSCSHVLVRLIVSTHL